MPEHYLLVLTTAGSEEQADMLARELVERRLAACVNIAPVCSVYRWKGAVQREEERLLVIKTAARLYERVAAAIHELHSYELPEVISLPLDGGSPEYLQWLGENLLPD